MKRKKSNRYLKKRLRLREKQLGKYLDLFLNGFNSEPSFSEPSFDDTSNFRLLLKLEWLVYDFIYLRLKMNAKWQKRQWFLELFDVDSIKIENGNVELIGDMVWWAEGKDAVGEW